MKELKYLVMHKNRIVAAFRRRWEAEKFIEISKIHNYELVITD